MMEEKAKVVAISKDMVTIESLIKSACSGCQQVDNCGSGQVSKALPQKRLSVNVLSDLPLSVGDEVVIGLSEKHLLSVAWQVYLWPLIGLISFGLLGQYFMSLQIFTSEPVAILLSILGGYLGFRVAKRRQQHVGCADLNVKILKILS